MKTLVVYESMFGNTRRIAEAIAQGLASGSDVKVSSVADANPHDAEDADLLVVGGPTHAWGMSRPRTRKGTPGYVEKPGSDLHLEVGADTGIGVREWLSSVGSTHARAVAFDTRIKGPAMLTGRASTGIKRELTHHGAATMAEPHSFFVNMKNHLLAGEIERGRDWGRQLASMISPRSGDGTETSDGFD